MCVLSSDDKIRMQDFNSQLKKSKIYVSKHIHRKPGVQEAINEAMSHKIRNPALLIVMRRTHVCAGGIRIVKTLSLSPLLK